MGATMCVVRFEGVEGVCPKGRVEHLGEGSAIGESPALDPAPWPNAFGAGSRDHDRTPIFFRNLIKVNRT